MPIYEYQCTDCGLQIERLQGFDDPAPEACEVCAGAMSRLVSAPAFQFKGTGWYVTDYGRKGKRPPEKSSDSSDSSSSSTSKDTTSKKSRSKESGPATTASSSSKA